MKTREENIIKLQNSTNNDIIDVLSKCDLAYTLCMRICRHKPFEVDVLFEFIVGIFLGETFNMCYTFLDLLYPQETDASWNYRHVDLFYSSQQGEIKE